MRSCLHPSCIQYFIFCGGGEVWWSVTLHAAVCNHSEHWLPLPYLLFCTLSRIALQNLQGFFMLLDQLVIGAGNLLLQNKWSVISAGNQFSNCVFIGGWALIHRYLALPIFYIYLLSKHFYPRWVNKKQRGHVWTGPLGQGTLGWGKNLGSRWPMISPTPYSQERCECPVRCCNRSWQPSWILVGGWIHFVKPCKEKEGYTRQPLFHY